MCGIAGYKVERPVPRGVIEAMTGALRHRGPDSDGFYRNGPYCGGMRRLAINDLETGDQPLYNADRSVVLLYNGEIYNYPALRRELEDRGYRFRTRSDGEVICHLYSEFGEELFEHLDGMFAAALWIEPEQRLILARDIPGEKPLYYTKLSDKELAFASEIKSLRLFPGLALRLDRQAIWDFPTFLWIPEPATVYEDVHALARGHLLIADRDGIRLRPYRNRFNLEPVAQDDASIVAETREVVTEAVRQRLLSDVPVGSFLSGGLDSSIVATIAARELGQIDTFCVGFEDLPDPYHGRSNESAEAAQYAKRINSRHHTIRVTADTFRDDLDDFCRYGDQPFAVSSGLGILSVARAAREAGIKVLLSGDGADECFGGYSWYIHLDSDIGDLRRGGDAGNGDIVSFQSVGLDTEDRLAALGRYSAQERAWAWHYYAHEDDKSALFHRDWRDGLDSSLRHFHAYKAAPDWSPEDFVAQDRNFYFPFEMLRKVDRMTMAHSVEGRVPFAAPAVLSHADKLRFRHMVRAGSLKWVLRQAFTDILPREILERPKHGFNVPIDHWLKEAWHDLLQETFSEGSALRRLGIVASGAGAIADRLLHDNRRLNGHTLFCFVMLNRWLEHTDA